MGCLGPKDGLRGGSEGREERGGPGLGPRRGEVWLGIRSLGRSDALLCVRTALGAGMPQRGASCPAPTSSRLLGVQTDNKHIAL